MKKGIDISVWQSPETIDYKTLAKNIDFAILRLGFTGHNNGNNPRNFNTDRHFNTHYHKLKEQGVPIGAYYYGGAKTYSEVNSEIEIVKRMLKDKTFEYPIYYDVEENLTHEKLDKTTLTNIVYDWCEKVEDLGYYVGIYASLHWMNSKLDKKKLARFDTWMAQWGVNRPAYTVGMWQYTSDGRVAGHNGRLDMNIAYKDYAKIIKGAGLNGFKNPSDRPDKPKPTPKPETPKPTTAYKIGDVVNFTTLANMSTAKAKIVKSIITTGKITKILKGRTYPYLINDGSGWVNDKMIKRIAFDVKAVAHDIWHNKNHTWGDGAERKQKLGKYYEAVQGELDKYYK